MMWLYGMLFLFIWTALGIIRLISRMGDKYATDEKWYDYVITAPVMAIIFFAAWLADTKG